MTRGAARAASPFKVAIDAHMVGEQETGNETYIVNLVQSLGAIDTDTRYFLYSPHPSSLDVCGPLPPNFIRRRVRPASSMLRIPFGMPARALMDRADLLHVTYVAPPVSPVPTVATVHDISYVLYPETFSRRDRLILGTLVPLTLKRSRAIITDSQSSRDDIVKQYGVPSEKISVVYLNVSAAFRQVSQEVIARARAHYGITGPYILAVGNLQPRKNLPRLIRAYAALRKRGAYQGQLVLVGKNKLRGSAIYEEVRTLGLEDEITFTGYVPEEDIVALHNGADVFVYPSIYEGFGLPPLEAMASGCPVVTGNTSSLPEVVGDAGLMVDPMSEEALSAAIERVVCNPDLRREFIGRGLDRARQFSAESTARATRDVYLRAAGASAPSRANSRGGALSDTSLLPVVSAEETHTSPGRQ